MNPSSSLSPFAFYGAGVPYAEGLGLRYPQRTPTEHERSFFHENPSVAGYAADDRSVVMNPEFTGNHASVLLNERLRHLFRETPQLVPANLTVMPHQVPPTHYSETETPEAVRATILARLLAGDPSAAPYSFQQQDAARAILHFLQQLK